MWSEDQAALSFFAQLNGAGIYDTWRLHNPVATIFTFSRGNSRSRLDRFYCDMGVAQFTTNIRHIEPLPGISDHSRVVLSLQRPNCEKWGRGKFKLNTNLLAIPEVQSDIRTIWANWRSNRDKCDSLAAWWDLGKIRICSALQRAAKRHSTSRSSAVQLLVDHVDSLTELVQSGDNSQRIRLELAKVELLDAKRLIAENRYVQQRIEEISAEKGNPQWYQLIKNRQVSTPTLRAVLIGDQLITEPNEVVSAAAQFYSELYSREDCDESEQDYFLSQIDRHLGEAESNQLENYFSVAEIGESLQQMKLGKSPGPDGLPVEFYRTFWEILKDDLTEVINSAWLSGQLPLSMRTATTSILFKKGDSRQLKNYRPVSLLNVDYKLLSKTLTLRVRKLMAQLICPYQACGVPDRQMSDNLLLIRLLQLYSDEHGWHVFFTSIDQQKAFDMVDHDYIQKVLAKMNFGPNFLRLIAAMYTDVTTCVKVNGKLSQPVTIHKGIRQGCALSMLLYVIALEPLLSAITNNRRIIGIKVPSAVGPDVSVKYTVYADDITLITADQYSVEESFALLNRYQSATGAKINRDKTEIVSTPNSPVGEPSLIGVPFATTIRVLGMKVGNNSSCATWDCLIQSCSDTTLKCPKWINTWTARKKFLHTYVYSQLWHIVAADPPTKIQLQRLNRVCYSFLFGSDYRPVVPATLALPINKGGIDLIWPKLRCEAFRLALLRKIAIADKPTDRPIWTGLLAYFIGYELAMEFPYMAKNDRKHRGDSIGPRHNLSPLLFHFRQFRRLNPGIDLAVCTAKVIYEKAVAKLVNCQLPAEIEKCSEAVFGLINCQKLPAKMREINLKCVYNCLIFSFSTLPCGICINQQEGTDHLLSHCGELAEYRRLMSLFCNRFSTSSLMSTECASLNRIDFGLDVKIQQFLTATLSAMRLELWKCYCRCKTDSSRPPPPNVLFKRTLMRLEQLVIVDIKRLSLAAARRIWEIPGKLSVYSGGFLYLD